MLLIELWKIENLLFEQERAFTNYIVPLLTFAAPQGFQNGFNQGFNQGGFGQGGFGQGGFGPGFGGGYYPQGGYFPQPQISAGGSSANANSFTSSE